MNSEICLSDNADHRVPPAGAPDPVAGSGQTLTWGREGQNTTAIVIGGAMYIFTAQTTGGFYFGISAIDATANIIWTCPIGETIVIKIPIGETLLNYSVDVDGAKGYLRRLTD